MFKLVRPVPVSFDLNFKMMYRDRFWAGVSYRKKDGFAAMAGINISPLINVSYAYDYVTSDPRESTTGSHETILGILLNNEEGARSEARREGKERARRVELGGSGNIKKKTKTDRQNAKP